MRCVDVRVLVADAGDHVAGLHGGFRPAVGFHADDGGATDLPSLRFTVAGLGVESDHGVWVRPAELYYCALHGYEMVKAYGP